jgi:hypothetical protein
MALVQNSNQQPLKKRNWMMLIINPRPTVNVIVVTVNVIDADHGLILYENVKMLGPPLFCRAVEKSPKNRHPDLQSLQCLRSLRSFSFKKPLSAFAESPAFAEKSMRDCPVS